MTNTAEKLTLPLFMVKYNGDLLISTGRSRFETSWKNKTMSWAALLNKLSRSMETTETHAEYMKMSKEQQDKIKDIGGFVGGHLRDGLRKTGYITARQLLTLDLDFPPAEFWDNIIDNLEIDNALAVYSTHKHTKAKPRYRLIMPLDREVTPDEYEAIARKIAEKIGIDYFDDSTFQPTRLMYWPSHSVDVEPFFQYYDAPFLAADSILAEYPDWTDTSYWPESSRMAGIRKRQADKQGDPLTKKGVVGIFCRTYSITEAIAKFLPGVYTPTAKEDRYTYAAGSTAAGLVVYDGDVFAYSNHSTDPAGGQLCNAFDLVRLHKFGHLDDGHEDKSGKDAPSYKAMADVARDDEGCKRTAASEQAANARQEFAQLEEAPEDWALLLERNAKMEVCPTLVNAVLIVQHDEGLQNIAYNDLKQAIEKTGPLPWRNDGGTWRDADDAQLLAYMNRVYQSRFTNSAVVTALIKVADDRHFNPLREYIQALPEWDGVSRVDTLLIDYRNRGQFHTSDPKPGDQIFFGNSISSSSHTGIVEKADGARVYTIEGNTSDRVARRSYALNDSKIIGYGRPAYDAETAPSAPVAPSIPPQKTVDELVDEVLAGQWGNGQERKDRLTAAGYDYATVQGAVNARCSAQKAAEKLAQDIATQLKSSGCDAAAVLKRVSEILA